jgi:choline dehydrogenase-like flavoprotein
MESARSGIRFRTSETVDFAVVGSGAAGGIIAKELSTAGFKVVVFEQGPRREAHEFEHDEIKTFVQGELTNDPVKHPITFRKSADDQAERGRAQLLYHRLVGGGSVMFTANYWRFRETDFEEHSRVGAISGTGLADWPITYRDLEPYYTKAEWELGVSGIPGPFDPPRSRPYPLPPLPVKSSGVLFERGARALGLHPQPTPLAILSESYRGRPACQHCGYCLGFGCEFDAKSSTLVTVIPIAEATGRCEIRSDSYVRKIEIDNRGRVTGVTYFDPTRQERFQRARAVVLCCNGAETPRLLLMSTSRLFPNGMANSSGLVGKHLMFNGLSSASGVFEHPLNEYKSVMASRVSYDFYETDMRRGFYGGGALDARAFVYPTLFALVGLPRDAPGWGTEYKRMLKDYYTRTMNVNGHSTSLPLETNCISLDPQVKDDWGMPAMRVTYKDHPDDLATMRFLQDKAVEVLEAAGARRTWRVPVEEQTFATHMLGTCRMGSDPQSSVIDADHRTHDIRNLFICDGSSLVTGGRGQPTATIQALAYRAGARIARLARQLET